MAITAAQFVVEFPEFDEANDLVPAMVAAALVEAQAYCSVKVWGVRYDRAVYTKCAHILCMTALGENARIDAKQATAYGEKFKEMVRALPMRVLVSGGLGGLDT